MESVIVISCWYQLLICCASWLLRLCLAHQAWNLLECQEWEVLTHPVCPNVFLQVVCSLWNKQHQQLVMVVTVEQDSKQPWLNFTACPVIWSLMTLLKSRLILSFLHVKTNKSIFLISWQVVSLHTRSCWFLQTMEIFPVPFKAVRMLSHMVASSQLTKDT